jgi:hypothetical protein
MAQTTSCSSAKRTQEAINTGNYLSAINTAVAKLKENKARKGNEDIILLLEEAFAKNAAREERDINFLKKDGNAANFEKIYNSYNHLSAIQDKVAALLPLRVVSEGRDASFNLKDYSNDILNSKTKLSSYLYSNATNLVSSASTKYDYRQAYNDLLYLDKINPGYKDTKQKIEDAHQKGIDFVKVKAYNASNVVIPQDLEDDLLNFNTYGLNDLWTQYHTNPQKGTDYNYEMILEFVSINISPEMINQRRIVKEKEIKDGFKYVLDDNGNVAKDSLGNDIKTDNFITVKSVFRERQQLKESNITAKVSYYDLNTNQMVNSYPITSGFIFEHFYGSYSGDKRALDEELIEMSTRHPIPFPSSEQMIYDSGEDLKAKLKEIITAYNFN